MRKDVDRILTEKGLSSMLLYSNSVKDANMYYMSGFLAPDPFIFVKRVDEQPLIVVNQMELSRAKKESAVKDVRSYFDYDYLRIVKSDKDPKLGVMKFVAAVAKKEQGKNTALYTPHNTPAVLVDTLRHEGLKVKPMFDVIEKARETKETEEIEAIKSVQRIVEEAATTAIDLIADADIGAEGKLFHREDGRKTLLTSGKVRSMFDHTFIDKGCIAEEETIVACGPGGADPHYSGRADDVLKANQPIVLDIFPRSIRKRYVSDMTRTVVRGKASKDVKRMFETVRKTKDAAADAIKAGVSGTAMQTLCYDMLEKAGYQTIRGGKRINKGYIHGLGHGIGLEVHEGPRMAELSDNPLEEHNVVSVEPGLYDPEIGGVRLEDVVEVTKRGCVDLTKMPIFLEV